MLLNKTHPNKKVIKAEKWMWVLIEKKTLLNMNCKYLNEIGSLL